MTATSSKRTYRLSDRYGEGSDRVFMTGIQALARLPLDQLRADRRAGRRTAAFASGYQGSPLSGLDQEFARAAATDPELTFVVQPNVNEELGATAVMGSQLASEQPDATHDGVLGIWYGKAPGLDRAGDAIRHGVYAGASHLGGALVIVGDDPAAKSSTVPSSSDLALMDLHLPVFYPGDVQEALDLGRHAIAMSRSTGLWTSLKIVTAVADGSGTVHVGPDRVAMVVPDMHIDGAPLVHRPDSRLLPPHNLEIERDIRTVRFERARRYSVANELNHVPVDPPDAWIGIAAAGITYHETREALRRLGLGTDEQVEAAGIRLFHLRLPLPFDDAAARRFGAGLGEVIVVEEKDPTIELLIKNALYGTVGAPRIVGKRDADGARLVPEYGVLDADAIEPALRRRLAGRLAGRLAPEPAPARERTLIPLSVERSPYFCSGCPHNWGTKVPEDSLVGAGIGCHTMTLLMDDDKVGVSAGLTQMGGEGAQWIGMSPFVERRHFIQNIGDGTFFHSGQLAVQAAIASGVNITYKLLHNGTVAMTGGQDPVGQLDVAGIAGVLIGHGVRRVIITTEDVDRYRGVSLPRDSAGVVSVRDRSHIVEAQEELAEIDGVTVLIHDQACAAQSRRLRKRDLVPTPARRVVINHRICEACGDCGVVSNCLSVQAIDTPLGVKTTIDQTTCNLDYSCLGGDCPSFMTVEPADGHDSTGHTMRPPTTFSDPVPLVADDHVDIRIAGIGGTGVVTASQVIAIAAMLDGYDSRGLDQTGLSQKAGPVVSDLRLSSTTTPHSNLLGECTVDVLLAFDLLVAASDHTLPTCEFDHTIVVGSTTPTPTGSMIGRPERRVPDLEELRARLDQASRSEASRLIDAGRLMDALLGNATAANIFVIGAAVQYGALPITADSLEQAIALNGVHVEANIDAFRWGRAWIDAPESVERAASQRAGNISMVTVDALPRKLARRVTALELAATDREIVEMLTADLVAYQHGGYAADFLAVVERVNDVDHELTITTARALHKLMAYKDEYEVARLLTEPTAAAAGEAVGGEGATVRWRLHPPILKAIGRTTKIDVSERVGRPMMIALARGKRLRGTRLDPFGRTAMRRTERALVQEYLDLVDAELAHVAGGGDRERCLASLALPMDIRGYEQLKMQRVAEFRAAVALRSAERSADGGVSRR